MATKGKIKIEADAQEVTKMFKDIESAGKKAENTTKSSFAEMNHTVDHFTNNLGKLKQAFVMINDAIDKVGEANMLLEKRALASQWLNNVNNDLATAVKHTAEYTHGMLQARDAIFMMNEATLKGIKMNSTQYANLMKLSTKLAILQGKDVKEVFEGFTVGVARLSPQIQENTGIVIKNGEVLRDYAKKHNTVVSALTQETQKQIILNKMIEEGKKKVKDLTDTDLDQGLIVSKQYTQYLEGKAKVTDKFYSKIGDIVKKYHSNEAREARRAKAMELASIITAQKHYAKLYAKFSQKYTKDTKAQIAQRILYMKQGTLQANAWVQNFYTLEKDIADRIMQDSDKAFSDKVTQNKINHFVMNFKRTLDSAVKSSGLYNWATQIGNKLFNKPVKTEKEIKKALEEYKRKKDIEIRAIIQFEKEKLNYSKMGEVEKIKTDEKLEALSRKLYRHNSLKKLKLIKLAYAQEKDLRDQQNKEKAQDRKRIADELKQISEDEEKETLKREKRKHKKELDELKRFVKDQKKIKQGLIEYDKEVAKVKAQIDKKATKEVSIARDITMSVLNALIEGNAKAIPKLLAQKAFMYGSDVLWKGVTDVAKGIGYNADPLSIGAGTALITAGQNEIIQGGAIMLAGGVASAMLNKGSDTESAINSDNAKSAGSADRMNTQDRIDKQKETKTRINLYPSEKEWLEKLRKSNKKLGVK